ncbi:MAG: hypothetical protein KGY80_01660 [Candidatus Thorarchaeota archaeon]|nr:hypothetical protein [Candidatus Thorarchaeota archaeon]
MIDQSDDAFSVEQLDSLWADLELSGNEKTLIITSPRPESLFAASLICRAYLTNHTPFTLTYADPVSEIDWIENISQAQGSPLTIAVGMEIHGPVEDSPNRCIFLGCDLPSESSKRFLGSLASLSNISFAFADRIVSLDRWHRHLAASVVLAQKWRNFTPSPESENIIHRALETGILEQRRGLRLFGINHLSTKDVLFHSIYPYLKGLSGVEDACEKLVKDANVPLSKRTLPMMSLSNDEKERISQIVIHDSSNAAIDTMFGEDYVFLHESKETPARFFSSMLPLLRTCWKLLELGTAASVCIGDRSRLLHSLIKSHIEHCKGTTSGFHTLTKRADEGNFQTSDNSVIISDLGVKPSVLPDVGRIAFDTGLFEPQRLLLLESNHHTEVVWNSGTHTINEILTTLENGESRIKSTSPYSLRLFDGGKSSEIAEMIHDGIKNTS